MFMVNNKQVIVFQYLNASRINEQVIENFYLKKCLFKMN